VIQGLPPESIQHIQGTSLPAELGAPKKSDPAAPAFQDLLSDLLTEVNHAQKAADQSIRQLAAGDGGSSIQDVVVKLGEADLTFRLMKEIRDKLLSAYKEVMSVQV
jgi:flagellar hook-basal body complex protein FliE